MVLTLRTGRQMLHNKNVRLHDGGQHPHEPEGCEDVLAEKHNQGPCVVVFTDIAEAPTTSLRCHLHLMDVPSWLHFPHIQSGYRLGGDYWSCCRSLFILHNECLNAWTMLLGAALSTASLVFALGRCGLHSAFVLFWTSLILHLPFSVGYHLFLPISPTVYNFWRRLDLSFVLFMSVQLTYAMNYFVLPHVWQTLLATGIDLVVALWGIRLLWSSVKDGQALERSSVTRCIGLSALGYYFPIVFQAVLDSHAGIYTVPFVASFVVPIGLAGGALIYEAHFPERFFPGKLDLLGNSHLWMHLGVILAHLMGFCFVIHNNLTRQADE